MWGGRSGVCWCGLHTTGPSAFVCMLISATLAQAAGRRPPTSECAGEKKGIIHRLSSHSAQSCQWVGTLASQSVRQCRNDADVIPLRHIPPALCRPSRPAPPTSARARSVTTRPSRGRAGSMVTRNTTSFSSRPQCSSKVVKRQHSCTRIDAGGKEVVDEEGEREAGGGAAGGTAGDGDAEPAACTRRSGGGAGEVKKKHSHVPRDR